MNEAILKHRDGAVQVLSINNSATRHAVTHALYAALPAALAEAQADAGIGAIVLTGVGNAFRAGGDLNRDVQRRTMTLLEHRAGIERLRGVIRSIRNCSKPVIAAVEDAAVGEGLSIALACDLLVATRNASFSVAYAGIGLSPGGRTTGVLSEFVSRRVLTELCLTGEHATGERMQRLGVVNRLAESGNALTEAITMAVTFASGPQRVVAHIKTLCRHASENILETALKIKPRCERESVTLH
jgi:enoyl-CoA hydratase/carnithine racemase